MLLFHAFVPRLIAPNASACSNSVDDRVFETQTFTNIVYISHVQNRSVCFIVYWAFLGKAKSRMRKSSQTP